MKFYWLNIVNLCEANGPFDTIESARESVLIYARQNGDEATAVAVLSVIETGSITMTYTKDGD